MSMHTHHIAVLLCICTVAKETSVVIVGFFFGQILCKFHKRSFSLPSLKARVCAAALTELSDSALEYHKEDPRVGRRP